MKFLLCRYLEPAQWEPVDDADFVAALRHSGELVDRQAVADPATGAVVRVRGGSPEVLEPPPGRSRYLAEYYLVDCESRERALELATLVPGGQRGTVEMRPVMTHAGLEM